MRSLTKSCTDGVEFCLFGNVGLLNMEAQDYSRGEFLFGRYRVRDEVAELKRSIDRMGIVQPSLLMDLSHRQWNSAFATENPYLIIIGLLCVVYFYTCTVRTG